MNAVVTYVLDNEAAQALARRSHGKHREVLGLLVAQQQRARAARVAPTVLLPAAVSVEALVDRTSLPGRLDAQIVPLDQPRAGRAVALRRQAGGSVVDACVAEVAASRTGNVVVLTSDLTDVPALLRAAGSAARTHRV